MVIALQDFKGVIFISTLINLNNLRGTFYVEIIPIKSNSPKGDPGVKYIYIIQMQ